MNCEHWLQGEIASGLRRVSDECNMVQITHVHEL